MQRREFILTLGGAAAWPLAAHAQQTRPMSRVGILTSAAEQSPLEAAVRQGLRDLGYIEGQNLVVEYRDSAGKPDRLAGLAAELIAAKVDIIFTAGSEATREAQRETKTIPIVMTSSNPLGLRLVASLSRPGGNITGLSLLGPEASGKRLEILKEIFSGLAKVAAFWNPNDPAAQFSLQETQAAAEKLAIKLQIMETRDVDAFIEAFPAAAKAGAEAVVLVPAPLMTRNAGRIAEFALKSRLPTVSYSDDTAKAGALLSYGPSLIASYRRAAHFYRSHPQR
jgi:putative ABC transport system substrate-binding protein